MTREELIQLITEAVTSREELRNKIPRMLYRRHAADSGGAAFPQLHPTHPDVQRVWTHMVKTGRKQGTGAGVALPVHKNLLKSIHARGKNSEIMNVHGHPKMNDWYGR